MYSFFLFSLLFFSFLSLPHHLLHLFCIAAHTTYKQVFFFNSLATPSFPLSTLCSCFPFSLSLSLCPVFISGLLRN
ncbi:hypothetical protein F4809DRAFT_618886 [Biscogniauxia mediterranea]|nr:hypothetical protein F4809DRAFT_618886 [Biscogniauxia mediterranea]